MPKQLLPKRQKSECSKWRPVSISPIYDTHVSADNNSQNPANRKSVEDHHDSDRSQWWRSTIKDTPIPGSYEVDNFIDELNSKKMTYGFKSPGRLRDPTPYGKGEVLLPGAYKHQDILEYLEKSRRTYSFKSSQRKPDDIVRLGAFKDLSIRVAPNMYKTEHYLGINVANPTARHWFFKSSSQRLPTLYFKPKDGPGPASYNKTMAINPSLTSMFKSSTPRFVSSHTRTPGPGTYEKTNQHGTMPKTVQDMGKQHGIFFTSVFS